MTTSLQETASHPEFDFVRTLAAELSQGNVDLPSFPEIAIRVRRILSDPDTTVEQVVRVVGSEPALAARLLRIANSASINRTGRAVTDLRAAINRIGYNMVRSASIAFAMAQIRKASKLRGLEHHLSALWERSSSVAAFSYVLARSCSKVNADEAMLTGMMHAIGKLYVLTRAADHPELFGNNTTLEDIIAQWHASIGKAILENWSFPEAMASAVGEQDDLGRAVDGPADLGDVIAVAILLSANRGDLPALEELLKDVGAAQRLGLDQARVSSIMKESAAEVSALSEALGG